MTGDVARVIELSVRRTVVTGFEWGVGNTVSASAKGTVGTAEGIGVLRIQIAIVTLFAWIDLIVAAEDKGGGVLNAGSIETGLSCFAGAVCCTRDTTIVDTEIGKTLGVCSARGAIAIDTGGACGTVENRAASQTTTVGAKVACTLRALRARLADAIETEVRGTLSIVCTEDTTIVDTESRRTITVCLALHSFRRVVEELGEGGVVLRCGGEVGSVGSI
jgi:hypothetical protein